MPHQKIGSVPSGGRQGWRSLAPSGNKRAPAGLFDVGGNALYVVARELVPIGLAAALIGLYPIVTMLLARFVLGETLPRLGQLGVGLALIGIVLISVGA